MNKFTKLSQNKFLRCYKRLLVSIYSTHFNEDKYEDKFIGMTSGLMVLGIIAFAKLIIMILGLNPIKADIDFKIPVFTLIIVFILLNFYFYKKIFTKEYIIEIAENYEYFHGGLKKRFWIFYNILMGTSLLIWAVLYSFYKSSFY